MLQKSPNFLVVWHDYRNGASSSYDIYGARVSSDGAVLDTDGIAISTDTNYQSSPAVAHNGMYFLVVWEDYRSYDIYGARVDSDGTVLDSSGISISTDTRGSGKYNPTVGYDGANFLVAWEDYRGGTGFTDIYGARVSETGTVLDTNGFIISAESVNETEPILTSMGGENSLVVYRSSHASASTNSERVLARFVQSP